MSLSTYTDAAVAAAAADDDDDDNDVDAGSDLLTTYSTRLAFHTPVK